ncbi:MAG: alpha/beta hydrolase [Thermoflexales bacterium]|nr:alpha/beta hydrolase [Thermoflexales bacterium]
MAEKLGHVIIGSGPEHVIAMGGWMGDHKVFAPAFPYLDRERFTWVFADPRGYGRSRHIAGKHTVKEVAGDVVALARSLRLGKFHFVGHSMNGMVAQYLCAHHGDRLKRVVGVTPVPATGAALEGDALTLFSNAWRVPANRGTICQITTGNRNTKTWEQAMIKASLSSTTREAFRDYYTMWTATNFVEDMRGVKTPFLALTGEHDLGVPTDFVRSTILSWMPNAELHVMANAGHYPMMETPVQFVTVVEAFLGRRA